MQNRKEGNHLESNNLGILFFFFFFFLFFFYHYHYHWAKLIFLLENDKVVVLSWI